MVTNNDARKKRGVYWGIGLISLASLLFELSLTRIFSVVMYYHFAFMVISLAMFGFGVSGLVAYIFPRFFPKPRLGRTLWGCAILFSLTILGTLLFVLQAQIDLSFKSENITRLIVIYLVAAIPFFFVGICVSVGMAHLSDSIGTLYFYDLLGASLGCVIAIPLMNVVGGPGAVTVAAAIAALGGVCFGDVANLETEGEKEGGNRWLALAALAFGVTMLGLAWVFKPSGATGFATEQFSSFSPVAAVVGITFLVVSANGRWKRLAAPLVTALLLVAVTVANTRVEFLRVIFTKGAKEENLLFSKWNSFSRISVDFDPASGHRTMKIDADAATHVVKTSGSITDEKPYREAVSGMAYHIKEGANQVLVIGPGGGWDIATACAFHCKQVNACEINPIIVNDVMKGAFKQYTGGLYEYPNVKVNIGEGRSFIRNSTQRYDVIQATLVDTWAATAGGALSLSENNLYTVEAFEDYLKHLTDNGVVTMTRWLFDPDQQTLRLTALGITALQRLGVTDPEKHIVLVSSGKGLEKTKQTICTFILKRTPFTDAEIEKLEGDAATCGFGIIYTPKTKPKNPFTELITARDRNAFIASYAYDISPTYDNKPFFFFTLKPKDFFEAFSGDYELVKNNAGLLALVSLLAIVTVLAFGCIIIPLFLFKRDALRGDTVNRTRSILYFAGLGIGFMALEMALLQKFVFFLGHPVYALAVVLFSILLFSSLGSMYTERIQTDRAAQSLKTIVGIMCVLVVAYLASLPWLLYTFLGLAVPIKIGLAVIMLAPLAFVMGMPLPLGVKVLRPTAPEMIPWAWGVNGAMSVLGSVLAVSLAVNFGYNALLVFGAGVYVFSALILPGKLAAGRRVAGEPDLAIPAGANA